MKKWLFLIISLTGLIANPLAYTQDLGPWDNSESHEKNWSKWSITDDYPEASVRMTVWIPVDKWKPGIEDKTKYDNPIKECKAENGNTCSVWSPDGERKTYNRGENHTKPDACGPESGRYGNPSAGCSCSLNTSDPTGYCVKGGVGLCGQIGAKECDTPAAISGGYTQRCYWYKCGQMGGGGTSHSCPGGEVSNDQGCGVKSTHYYAKESDTFKDETDSKNWKPSLDAAGGYAKKTYIYSYPLDFYIEFNGNGAQGTCDFKQGLNKYSNASNIEYYKGNPVCESAKSVGGTMPKQTISYVNGGKLNQLKYYRDGYDFVGWAANKDATKATFDNKEKVTAKELLAKPNETVVLYAIWKKHDYEVNYNQICGTTNKTTFNYDKGTSLPSPDLTKCEEPNIKFEGWYTENEHIHKVDSIPSGTKEDLDLYAKLSQKRYYNYSTKKWTIVKQ